MYNREFEVNEKQVADYLESAVSKVRTTEDVDTLSDLVKLFKKNVPLTLRKYVIAYMLKEALKHFHSYEKGNNRNNKNDNRNDRNERNDRNQKSKAEKQNNRSEKAAEVAATTEQAEEHQRHPRVEIPETEATSIFISIGKNRRVYPRDLVGLLIGVANLDRERIGDIKVLANYSFVQLYSADAPAAIEKLNGYDYRGRKLAVSYSRQKTDDEVVPAETEGYTSEAQDAEMAAEDAAAYAAAEKAAADKEPFGL